jgi:hypothetical protein
VIIGHDVAYHYGQPKQLLEIAKLYKVDPAKVKKAIADEAKEAAAAAKAAAPAKKAKPAKRRRSRPGRTRSRTPPPTR